MIQNQGGRIPPGSGKPSSTCSERGACMHLLQDILNIYNDNKFKGGTIIIYINNMTVIDHSSLPSQGSGPTKVYLR